MKLIEHVLLHPMCVDTLQYKVILKHYNIKLSLH